MQFTHVAAYEAVKLVRNMLFPGKSALSYEHVPWALFTDPVPQISNVMLAGWFATGGGGVLFLPTVSGDPYVYQEVGSDG